MSAAVANLLLTPFAASVVYTLIGLALPRLPFMRSRKRALVLFVGALTAFGIGIQILEGVSPAFRQEQEAERDPRKANLFTLMATTDWSDPVRISRLCAGSDTAALNSEIKSRCITAQRPSKLGTGSMSPLDWARRRPFAPMSRRRCSQRSRHKTLKQRVRLPRKTRGAGASSCEGGVGRSRKPLFVGRSICIDQATITDGAHTALRSTVAGTVGSGIDRPCAARSAFLRARQAGQCDGALSPRLP
jgi:hypothetical protein